MRWCYKTVHYDLKKEGFLGSSFLDESEVEQSLNEYGQAGWELVSVTGTQDGLIAIFKQPLEPTAEPLTVTKGTEAQDSFFDETEAGVTEKDIIEDDNDIDDTSPENGLHTIRIE